ncbi:MAG: hypothetical protein GTN76_04090, partial [Candidatus Aenigmarchaeota archaeon]|nr:hypothetical protein [Candidatus Aenigmarchaeota archaeon]
GSPTPDVSASYSVNLHRWHEGSGLEKVRKVAEADTGIEFIKIYYDQRVIVIRGNDYSRRPVRNVFSILSMDRPLVEKSFKVEYPEGVVNSGKHLFDIPGKGAYEEIQLSSVVNKKWNLLSFEGVNIETLQREELSRDVYKHLVLYGEAGVAMPGWDVIRVGMNEDRNIEISLPGKIV